MSGPGELQGSTGLCPALPCPAAWVGWPCPRTRRPRLRHLPAPRPWPPWRPPAAPAGAAPSVWQIANWTLGMPLEQAPGEKWIYSNNGYTLLTWLVEQVGGRGAGADGDSPWPSRAWWRALQQAHGAATRCLTLAPLPFFALTVRRRTQASGQPLGEYLAANVFGPAGLNATFYDTSNGAAGVHERSATGGGYVAVAELGMEEGEPGEGEPPGGGRAQHGVAAGL